MGVATRMSEHVAPFPPPPPHKNKRSQVITEVFTDIFAPFTSDIFFLHVSFKVFQRKMKLFENKTISVKKTPTRFLQNICLRTELGFLNLIPSIEYDVCTNFYILFSICWIWSGVMFKLSPQTVPSFFQIFGPAPEDYIS